jgi:outer membrane lipoprotein carrier protein
MKHSIPLILRLTAITPLLSVGLAACGEGAPEPPEQVATEQVAQVDPASPTIAAPGDPGSPPQSAAGLVQGAPGPEAQPGPPLTAGPPPSGPQPPVVTAGGSTAPMAPPPAPSGQSTGSQANDIIDRAEQAYAAVRSMEADFVQRVFVPLLQNTQSSRGKIYHRAPDRFLMRFSDPAGDILLADGRYVWMYYPSTDPRQVLRQPLADGAEQIDLQKQFLSNASARFNVTRTGGETVGGRQTHALTLIPRSASAYRQIRIWVDTQDFLVRRFEISEENETVRTVELSNLRPNVTLGDEIFEFTPPAGAQIYP